MVLDVCTVIKHLRSLDYLFIWFPAGGQQFAVGSELQSGPDEEISAVVGTEI